MVTTRSRDKSTAWTKDAAATPKRAEKKAGSQKRKSRSDEGEAPRAMKRSQTVKKKDAVDPNKGNEKAGNMNQGTSRQGIEKPKKKESKSAVKSSEMPAKRKRAVKEEDHSETKHIKEEPTILINRSPVLHLWTGCVAHFLYPELPWTTCLSVGSAVSTICAVAKGRSIGTIDAPDTSDEKKKRKEEAKSKNKDLDSIDVMHFHLKLKDGRALVGSQGLGKPGKEEGLKRKFGEEEYRSAKQCFGEVLGHWKGNDEGLNQKAFHFYELFRPSVSGGQRGWGKKGALDLGKVRRVVGREG